MTVQAMTARGFGLVLGIAVLGALGPSPVQAEEGEFMRGALSGIGLIEPDRPSITYRERAPLAMPPKLGGNGDLTAGLPLPQARQAPDPQWPKDPEISRRERAATEARKPIVRGAQGRMNDNNETLSVYEMDAGRKAGASALTGPAGSPNRGDTRDSTWLNPFELLSGTKADAEPSEIEPERAGLTDPPTGYRKAPMKVAKPKGGPVGNSISGNEEADPRAYLRSQSAR